LSAHPRLAPWAAFLRPFGAFLFCGTGSLLIGCQGQVGQIPLADQTLGVGFTRGRC
jgi:hypothetical protein